MPHRGRLNVLANLLQKSYKRMFNEFVGDYSSVKDSTGDVKYHLGASSDRELIVTWFMSVYQIIPLI